jgi:hypothetical protein
VIEVWCREGNEKRTNCAPVWADTGRGRKSVGAEDGYQKRFDADSTPLKGEETLHLAR